MSRINNVCFVTFLFFSFVSYPSQGRQKQVFTQNEMGSPFTITIYSKDSSGAALAAKKAFAEVARLNDIFSDYADSSELNKLCRQSGQQKYVDVSAELFSILQRSLQASYASHGRFDITVGPVVRLWRKARKEKSFPPKNAIRQALKAVGYQYIHLDTIHRSVWLEKPHMQLDLGGIGKGYAAQAAYDIIKQSGFSSAMVNAGGDMVLGDAPPSRTAWIIGVALPESYEGLMPGNIRVKHKAVATSGDIYQFVEWKGKKYSHIVNPKTGYGVTYLRNVTVVADDGALADWLASACSVLSLSKSLKLIKNFPGAALLIEEKRGNKIRKVCSDNMKAYLKSL